MRHRRTTTLLPTYGIGVIVAANLDAIGRRTLGGNIGEQVLVLEVRVHTDEVAALLAARRLGAVSRSQHVVVLAEELVLGGLR